MSDTGNSMLPPPNRPTTTSQQQQQQQQQQDQDQDGVEDRHMNDSTMPPPRRYANTKTTPASISTPTTTTTTTTTATATATATATTASTTVRTTKKKAAVNPRHRFGLHDWKRLLQASNDLAQRKGQPIRRDIPLEEVVKHNRNHDGWIILRGRVYNIGPYLPYHPGGVRIFKNALGKDATALFDKYHRWVNIDGLIGPLLLGSVAVPATQSNPFSVVPPKEAQLTNAPRISTQAATGSSLLMASTDDDSDDEKEDQILPPPSIGHA